MISQKAKYALKAMIHLAQRPAGKPVLIAVLAKEERLPQKFLERILLDLKTHGLLESRKGKGGGYLLARPADKISLGDVLRLMDGPLALVSCVSKTAYRRCRDCPSEEHCYLRPIMKEVRDSIARILDGTSLADAVKRADQSIESLTFEI